MMTITAKVAEVVSLARFPIERARCTSSGVKMCHATLACASVASHLSISHIFVNAGAAS